MDVLSRFKIMRRCHSLPLFTLLISTFGSTGCLGTYLVKSGYNQMQLLSERQPIEKILEKKELPPEVRQKLELTLDVRRFLTEKLKLKNTKNYTTYVDIGRPHVTYIVTAAYKNKLESKPYWYPLVGRLPYKGFFERTDADGEAKTFDPSQFDTMVRGVKAYSTLGWFEDPLLSSMLAAREDHLVNTLIHESTHATLFIKGNADFNERLATFVGNLGAEMYYLEKEGPQSPTLQKIYAENEDEKLFSDFISREILQLKNWYKENSQLSSSELEAKRQVEFQNIQERFTMTLSPKLKTKIYSGFEKAKLNNAILLHYGTYVQDLAQFQNLYLSLDKDFFKFITFCQTLEKHPDPLLAVQEKLRAPASAASAPASALSK